MKKILLTFLLLLSPLSLSVPSLGSVDGKGVSCDNGIVNGNITYYFLFADGEAIRYKIRNNNDEFEYHPVNKYSNWGSTEDEIYWSSYDMKFQLNRKTLLLEKTLVSENIKQFHKPLKCEVHSLEDFFSLLDRRVEEKQIKFDEGRRSNKI